MVELATLEGEPVNPAAWMTGCCTSAFPASRPSTRASEPAGAPAASSAPATIAAVRSDSRGWPEWALTITGFPAARAEAVSPPATENANGKLEAENTATGPTPMSMRRSSGDHVVAAKAMWSTLPLPWRAATVPGRRPVPA